MNHIAYHINKYQDICMFLDMHSSSVMKIKKNSSSVLENIIHALLDSLIICGEISGYL